jgi:hypothetical protein
MSSRAIIVIDLGSGYATFIYLNDSSGNPIDLSSYTVVSQFRKTYTSINAYSFTVAANSSGSIELLLSGNTSATIPPGRYVYDIKATDPYGNSTRILEGQVTINPSVSR